MDHNKTSSTSRSDASFFPLHSSNFARTSCGAQKTTDCPLPSFRRRLQAGKPIYQLQFLDEVAALNTLCKSILGEIRTKSDDSAIVDRHL